MGIKGLTQFLEKNFTFRQVDLQDIDALAIDGNNICNQLYEKEKLDWMHGGEYAEFAKIVHSFFSGILKANVKPIVVLDGLRDAEKVAESWTRREDTNKRLKKWQEKGQSARPHIVFPILIVQTFVSVINELQIDLRVSAGEGDQLVAAVSNAIPSCPVLASDSDYFMFELQNGYIPLQYFSHSRCSLYHSDDLKTQFCLQDTQIRWLIPCIHGNDFMATPVQKIQQKYEQTLSDLKKYNSTEEYMAENKEYLAKNSKFKENYESAKNFYHTMLPAELLEGKLSDFPWLSTEGSNNTIDFHFSLIRITKYGEIVFNSAVENITQECVWECSKYIRQFIYGLLEIPAVYEQIRERGSPSIHAVPTQPRKLDPPQTRTAILQAQDYQKEEVVLAILKCNKMKYRDELLKLPSDSRLFAATIFYWYITSDFATDPDHLVRALLLTWKNEGVSSQPRKVIFEDLHAFSQWQCVYSDAIALNHIADLPFEAPSPASVFSGKTALYYATKKSEYLASEISSRNLSTMFKIVTCKKERIKGKTRVKEAEITGCDLTDSNPFAMLSIKTD